MAFPILGALKLAVNAGSHIYKKKKETQMMMANAQATHAQKMANGELEYSGKLLEARQSDWKDEFVLVEELFYLGRSARIVREDPVRNH